MLIVALYSFFSIAYASLDDFVEFDDEQTAAANAELNQNMDTYFAHRDLADEGEDAPIIQFKIFTADEHGDAVGSFQGIDELLRGKSDAFRLLIGQFLIASAHESTSQAVRIRDLQLLEEFSAIMFTADYMDNTNLVWRQLQVIQWSDDGTKKCVFTSESSERVFAFYEDTVADALVDLVTYCSVSLNAHGKKLSES